MSQLASNHPFEQAVEAYGHEGAERAMGVMLDSVACANQSIKPFDDVTELQTAFVGFNPNYTAGRPLPIIGVYKRWRGIGLAFNTLADVDEVIEYIPSTLVHEITHAAIFQRGIVEKEFENNHEWTIFQFAVNEGIAVQAQDILLGENNEPHFRERYVDISDSRLDNTLEELMDHHRKKLPCTGDDIKRLLAGDDECPRIGYRVGYYVVGLARTQGMSLQDLINKPLASYADLVL